MQFVFDIADLQRGDDPTDHMGSSQSRIVKLEAGDSSVTLELLIKATFVVGGTRKELAQAIA